MAKINVLLHCQYHVGDEYFAPGDVLPMDEAEATALQKRGLVALHMDTSPKVIKPPKPKKTKAPANSQGDPAPTDMDTDADVDEGADDTAETTANDDTETHHSDPDTL